VLSTLSLAGNWSLIQKFYSARSDNEAVRVGCLATLLFLVLPPVWIATGMLARGYLTSIADTQSVYAHLSSALLPAGMLGLIVAALVAATMSVLSSGYNVMSAVLTLDVYRRLLRPAADQKELVLVGRILTAALALIVLALALAITHFRWTIFDTMVAAFGFFLPPTVLPMLAGLLSRSLSAAGALAGFVAGIGIGLAFLFYRWVAHPQNVGAFQALSIVVPTVLTAAVLVIAAVFFPARGTEADRALCFSLGACLRYSYGILTQPGPNCRFGHNNYGNGPHRDRCDTAHCNACSQLTESPHGRDFRCHRADDDRLLA